MMALIDARIQSLAVGAYGDEIPVLLIEGVNCLKVRASSMCSGEVTMGMTRLMDFSMSMAG